MEQTVGEEQSMATALSRTLEDMAATTTLLVVL